jgi:hypothetical protein
MALEDIQRWLSVATGIATLVALAIGIVQLAYVRRSMALQTNLAVMQAERAIWSLALANPEVAPATLKARWGEPAGERLFGAMLLDHYEALYFQRCQGAIPRANWAPIERAMMEHISSEPIRTIWESHKDLYWPKFVKRVERNLAKGARTP